MHGQQYIKTFLHVSLKQMVKTGKRFDIVQVRTYLLLEYVLVRVTEENPYFQNRKIL